MGFCINFDTRPTEKEITILVCVKKSWFLISFLYNGTSNLFEGKFLGKIDSILKWSRSRFTRKHHYLIFYFQLSNAYFDCEINNP